MEPWELAIRIVLLGLSVIMLVVALQARRRMRGRRMTWVVISFIGFSVLAAAAMLGEAYEDPTWSLPNTLVILLLLVIGANYLALFRD